MQLKSILPLLALAAVGLICPAAVWGQCDPENRKTWEQVYRFPAPGEERSVVSVNRDSLLDERRIRPGYQPWLELFIPALLKAGLEGAEFTKLEVYRDCAGNPRVIADGEKNADPPPAIVSTAPVVVVEEATLPKRKVSKKRRAFAAGMRVGFPIVGNQVIPGIGWFVGSVIVEPFARAVENGGETEESSETRQAVQATDGQGKYNPFLDDPFIRKILIKRGLLPPETQLNRKAVEP